MAFREVTVVQIREALRRWLRGEGERSCSHCPPSKIMLHWLAPAGTPTTWQPPGPFVVVGSAGMNNITINGGAVTGSFSPFVGPTATLSDANWPGVAGAVATGCASATGLRVLTLGTS